MERYLTPPGSPSLIPVAQLSTPSPRRLQSPMRRKTNDTLIEQWATLMTKTDEIVAIEEAQETISDQIFASLRTDLLKELDKTAWMYNERSYS